MSDFQDHLLQTCTTLCHCWRLTRRDGQIFGFTDHDRALVVAGESYEPQSGFARSEATSALGLAVDTVDVEGAISSTRLSESAIEAGLLDGAIVETLLVNWREPAQHRRIRTAAIGRITRSDGRFLAELESLARHLDKPNGRYLRRSCDAALGDARCGKDISGPAFNGTGTVVEAAGPGAFVAAGLEAFETGWFSFGALTWTSGALAGRIAAIGEHKADPRGTILTLSADAGEPAAGGGFTVVAGCDKRFATCRAKFSNPVNFRGFPHLPGNDAAYGYVAEGQVFDGGPIVP